MSKTTKTLYLVDGHYQIYRAFYGLPDRLTSPSGEPTGATHVFCMMLASLIRERRPDYLAVAMDVSDETVFRREIDAEYKAHRDPAPEALHVQKERILSIVSALRIPLLEVAGFEADDVMATVTRQLGDQDVRIFLVSRDKDLEQLVSDRVYLFDPLKDIEIGPETLSELKGYTPEQALEVQTLVGDTSDNVPGIPGVGLKTAVKLIDKYGSAEEVVKHADELTPKLAQRVKAFARQLPTTRQLITLRLDVPVDFDLDDASLKRLDLPAVRPLFDELGFTTVREHFEELGRLLELSRPDAASGSHVEARAAVLTARGRYELVDTEDKLEALRRELARRPAFAIDTETTGLQPMRSDLVGLSFAFEKGTAYYVPVRAAVGEVIPVSAVLEKLGPVLADRAIEKVGHNLKYDLLVLHKAGIDLEGIAFDTMIASFLLDPLRRGHSLDSLAKSLLHHDMIPITDLIGKGKHQLRMDEVETGQVCEYAAEDADFTWRLYESLRPRISGSHAEELFHQTEMPLVAVLAAMEFNGIALDVPLLGRIGEEIEQRLDRLTREVHQLAGRPFNIDSPKQLGEVLFDELGFTSVKKTKTGRSTDAATLQALAAQTDHALPGRVLEYRELSKLKGTYVDTLPRMVNPRTGRIHASFNQIGAVTGRLSSNHPNLQNIPVRTAVGRRIREAFIAAGPDQLLLTADYSQIELRLLAHFCRDEALVEAFHKGQDIHRAVAAQVNAVALEDVTPEQRSAAKAVNFGIIYGQSPFGLSRALGIPVGDARAFIDRYFQRYPGIRGFIDRCIRDAREKGYAPTLLGRRRPIPELTSRNRGQVSLGERLAVNTVVQGSAADLIKRAMVDIHREIGRGACPARMLIQVHDELVFEAQHENRDAAATVVRARMEGPMPLHVPLVVDLATGPNWAESK